MEAELEACHGAFGGHLVELVLVVAGEAGVAGVVGVGLVHGGGAGAEGAVHVALELGEMEAEVVAGVAGAALLEDLDGPVEVHPLGYADGEFVGVLEFLEGEEVVPVGVVLHGGDSVGDDVGDRYGEGLATLLEGWRRNFAADEALAAASRRMPVGLPEASRSILAPAGSGVAAVMLAAARAAELATDMCPSTRRRRAGWPAVTCVEVGAGGEFVVGPEGVVPSSTFDPCAGFGGGDVGADALLHLGEGVDADEVDGELLAAGFADVGVGVVEAGHREGAVQVDDLGLGAFEFEDCRRRCLRR